MAGQGVPVHAYRDLGELPRAVDRVVASAWYPQSYRRFFARYPRLTLLIHDQIEIFYPLGGRYLYRLATASSRCPTSGGRRRCSPSPAGQPVA